MKHLVELGAQLTGAVLLHESIGAVANHGQQPGTRVVTVESVEEAECAHNGLLCGNTPPSGQVHPLRLRPECLYSTPTRQSDRIRDWQTAANLRAQSSVARRRSSCSSFTRRMPE